MPTEYTLSLLYKPGCEIQILAESISQELANQLADRLERILGTTDWQCVVEKTVYPGWVE